MLRCWRGFCLWFMTAVAVLARRFASVHACLFSFVRKKETACDILRSCSAGSRSPFARSRGVGVVICLLRVHFGVGCFFVAISTGTGLRGTRGYEGTGSAARVLCAFARAHWRSESFRGEYVGGCAPPNLRQRVFDSLDSLHAAAGLRWCGFAAIVARAGRVTARAFLCTLSSRLKPPCRPQRLLLRGLRHCHGAHLCGQAEEVDEAVRVVLIVDVILVECGDFRIVQ